MLFSSIPFLYYYLPVVLIVYFLAQKWARNGVLLFFSLIFYGWGEPKFLLLMITAIVAFYGFGLAVGYCRRGKKLWLTASAVTGLILLTVFKYADFFIGSFSSLTGLSLPLLRLTLPIGISFYTFQCMSYVVDVYRGSVAPQKNPISFGAYVALFPQLIAGPIVRYADIARELEDRRTTWEDACAGARRFLIGLGKKVLIANQMGQLTALYQASGEKSLVFAWMYAIAFALQIYFDFSGYSDMAIGLGRILGFHFIENFNYPYISRSITEFWRRWHISLGSWFRDYVYIPLGGNRVSKGRWVFNIFTVWMLTGLWHGAGWNFVAWGLLYAVMLLLEKQLDVDKLPNLLRHVYVLLVVMVGFVLFNGETFAHAGEDLAGMFGFGGLPFVNAETLYYLRSFGLLFLAAMVGSTPILTGLVKRIPEKAAAVLEPLVLIGLLLVCTAYLVDGSFNPFLYFRF